MKTYTLTVTPIDRDGNPFATMPPASVTVTRDMARGSITLRLAERVAWEADEHGTVAMFRVGDPGGTWFNLPSRPLPFGPGDVVALAPRLLTLS